MGPHRTDALDRSRAAIREGKVVVPREEPIVRELAEHLACDAKVRGRGDRGEALPLHPDREEHMRNNIMSIVF